MKLINIFDVSGDLLISILINNSEDFLLLMCCKVVSTQFIILLFLLTITLTRQCKMYNLSHSSILDKLFNLKL